MGRNAILKYGWDYYKDPENVPIIDLARELGLNVRRGAKMRCPCPDHNDTHPSAVISETGHYKNMFKCWSCQEYGGPIELVIAVRSGLSPTKYWDMQKSSDDDLREIARQARNDAIEYIERLYPGNVISGAEEEEYAKKIKTRSEAIPEALKGRDAGKIFADLGIENPFKRIIVEKCPEGMISKQEVYDSKGNVKDVRDASTGVPKTFRDASFTLSYEEAVDLVINAIDSREARIRQDSVKFFKEASNLDTKTMAHISRGYDNLASKYDELKEELLKLREEKSSVSWEFGNEVPDKVYSVDENSNKEEETEEFRTEEEEDFSENGEYDRN